VLAAFLILKGVVMHGGPVATMPWSAALLGVLVAALIGITAGVLPARRAAALDPVDALR
jgi:putative ABC transport system permease protein